MDELTEPRGGARGLRATAVLLLAVATLAPLLLLTGVEDLFADFANQPFVYYVFFVLLAACPVLCGFLAYRTWAGRSSVRVHVSTVFLAMAVLVGWGEIGYCCRLPGMLGEALSANFFLLPAIVVSMFYLAASRRLPRAVASSRLQMAAELSLCSVAASWFPVY